MLPSAPRPREMVPVASVPVLAFAVLLSVAGAMTVQRQGCMGGCDNGGLCLPSGSFPDVLYGAPVAHWSCFCKAPFVGLTCRESSDHPTGVEEPSTAEEDATDDPPVKQVGDFSDNAPLFGGELAERESRVEAQMQQVRRSIEAYEMAPMRHVSSPQPVVAEVVATTSPQQATLHVALHPLAHMESQLPLVKAPVHALTVDSRFASSKKEKQKLRPGEFISVTLAFGSGRAMGGVEAAGSEGFDETPAGAQLATYMALCPDLPCSLGLAVEDIIIQGAHGSTVVLDIFPRASSTIEPQDIVGAFQSQLADSTSPLRDALPDLLPERSSAYVAQTGGRRVAPASHRPLAAHGSSPAPADDSALPLSANLRSVVQATPHGREFAGSRDNSSSIDSTRREYKGSRDKLTVYYCTVMLCMIYAISTLTSVFLERLIRARNPSGNLDLQADAIANLRGFHRWYEVAQRSIQSMIIFPLLCLIFLAARMRVYDLTKGYGTSPEWLFTLIIACTASAVVNSLIVVIRCVLLARGINTDTPRQREMRIARACLKDIQLRTAGTQDGEWQNNDMLQEMRSAAIWVISFEAIAFSTMYACAFSICVVIVVLKPESCLDSQALQQVWPEEGSQHGPPMPAEMRFGGLLALQYLIICFCSRWANTIRDIQRARFGADKWPWRIVWPIFGMAKFTVNLVPMIVVVFLGFRQYDLFLDQALSSEETPESNRIVPMQIMQVATLMYSLLVLVSLFLPKSLRVMPVLSRAGKPEESESRFAVECESDAMRNIFDVARCLLLVVIYATFIFLLYILRHPAPSKMAGPSPPGPEPIYWVTCLSTMFIFFFVVNFVQTNVTNLVAAAGISPPTTLRGAMREIRNLVTLCPMLAILCFSVSMRAFEVKPRGQPQGWALMAMKIVCLALSLKVIVALLWAALMPTPPPDADELYEMPMSLHSTAEAELPSSSLDSLDRGRTTDSLNDPGSTAVIENPRSPELKLSRYQEWLNMLVVQIQGLLNVAICASAAVLITSVLSLTRETANGEGSLFFDGNPKNNFFPSIATMSTTMKCIICGTFSFFLVKVIAVIVLTRNYAKSLSRLDPLQIVLNRAVALVEFIPILCGILLLGRLRAQKLQGQNASPPHSAQNWAKAAMVCLHVQIAVTFIRPLLVNKTRYPLPNRFLKFFEPLAFMGHILSVAMFGVEYFLMTPENVVLPDGKTGVAWHGDGQPPPVSQRAVPIGLFIAVFYFVAMKHQVLDWIMRHNHHSDQRECDGDEEQLIVRQGQRQNDLAFRLHKGVVHARETMSCAPTIVIFLVCMHMYLLKIGVPEAALNGHWGILFTFATCVALLLETALVIVIAVRAGPTPGLGDPSQGDLVDPAMRAAMDSFAGSPRVLDLSSQPQAWLRRATQFTLGLGAVAFIASFASMWFIAPPHKHEKASLLPEVWCAMAMLGIFLFVNFVWRIWALVTVPPRITALALDAAGMAPMFAVLFIALRGRGIELAGDTGRTPLWIVQVMDAEVFVMVGLILCTMLLPFVAELRPKTEFHMQNTAEFLAGSDMVDNPSMYGGKSTAAWRQVGRIFVLVIRNVLLFTTFAGAGIIVFGFFFMTRKTCTEATP